MSAGPRPVIIAPRWRWAALLALSLAAVAPARAAPDADATADPDPIASLLAERSLAREEPRPGLIQTMRSRSADMVIAAFNFLGVPYRYGGNNASEGFDCSGFTRHLFATSLGLVLPRRSDEQAQAQGLVSVVEKDDLRPGDLVFFNTLKRAFSHVGIYIGEGRFIHSPRSGAAVRVEDMRYAYWAQRYNGARRVDAGAETVSRDATLPPGIEH